MVASTICKIRMAWKRDFFFYTVTLLGSRGSVTTSTLITLSVVTFSDPLYGGNCFLFTWNRRSTQFKNGYK